MNKKALTFLILFSSTLFFGIEGNLEDSYIIPSNYSSSHQFILKVIHIPFSHINSEFVNITGLPFYYGTLSYSDYSGIIFSPYLLLPLGAVLGYNGKWRVDNFTELNFELGFFVSGFMYYSLLDDNFKNKIYYYYMLNLLISTLSSHYIQFGFKKNIHKSLSYKFNISVNTLFFVDNFNLTLKNQFLFSENKKEDVINSFNIMLNYKFTVYHQIFRYYGGICNTIETGIEFLKKVIIQDNRFFTISLLIGYEANFYYYDIIKSSIISLILTLMGYRVSKDNYYFEYRGNLVFSVNFGFGRLKAKKIKK